MKLSRYQINFYFIQKLFFMEIGYKILWHHVKFSVVITKIDEDLFRFITYNPVQENYEIFIDEGKES